MNLVTGGAGFIGSHLVDRLLSQGETVAILDNFNDFYDPHWKRQNIDEIRAGMSERGDPQSNLTIIEGDIRDQRALEKVFDLPIGQVVHLAAMAGVRPSLQNPVLYTEVNVSGTTRLLEMCRRKKIEQFILASSSSVYGNRSTVPFRESDPVDFPVSPYAATKKAGELLCHTYHFLYGLNIACLRFFTVYGPRQRPDLAICKFARLMLTEKEIPLYGDGSTQRDYTYVTDIVDGVIKSMQWLAAGARPKYEIFNLGNSQAISLKQVIETLEKALGKKALVRKYPVPPGDVIRTWADISKAQTTLGYQPTTDFEEGIGRFIDWYQERRDLLA